MKYWMLCWALLCSLNSTVLGQSAQKIAYVDVDEVIRAMPEYVTAKEKLERFQKELVKILDERKRNIAAYYQTTLKQLQSGELNDQQQKEAQAKLQQLQERLRAKTEESDLLLVEREQQLTTPVYKKFDAALKELAQQKGYIYVLDKQLLLYQNSSQDITKQLKKKLGIR